MGPPNPFARNLLRALGAAAVVVLAARDGLGADNPQPATTETVEAIEGLRSPFLAERLEAVERLVELGGSARPAVVAAFSTEAPPVRRHLAEVLARDGSPEAIGALLDALPDADVATASAIRRAVAGQAERASPILAQRLKAADPPPRRLQDLLAILLRARIERIFLDTRSKSGGTGYYRGQFDALLPYREEAVAVCFAILADRQRKLPGEFPVGGYRFLREPDPPVDPIDARVMAGNALAELLRPGDTGAIEALAGLYARYWAVVVGRSPFEDVRQAPPEETLLDTILPALHRLDPQRWNGEVEQLLEWYENRSLIGADSSAMLLLRVGRYEEAIRKYARMIAQGYTAFSHYNIACAYATWSREDAARAKLLRERAIHHLQESVRQGYLDWPWMEQDTDLDPIRGDARYKALVEKVKAEFLPPGSPAPRGEGTPPPPPEDPPRR